MINEIFDNGNERLKGMPTKKHILVISQTFYPEQFRINDICAEWVARGYKITVLTGIPNYPEGTFFKGYGFFKNRKDNYRGVNIIRIPIIPRFHNVITLSLNYISFVISGWFWKTFTRVDADIVFINQLSPMTQALPGIWYAKRKKVPCFIYVQDLWPESVEVITGTKNRFFLGALGRMADNIYSRCNKIFISSKGFIKKIEERGVPREKIIFWPQYPEDYYCPADRKAVNVPEINSPDAFNIIFAGNIGEAQGLSVLPKAANLLMQKNIDVMFHIVGDGRFKSKLLGMVKEMGVEAMFNFVGRQPAKRIPEFMAVCDAAIITLSKSPIFAVTLPAKTQSCMACGIPILVCADGEVQQVINEAGAGLCSDADNAEMLADTIEKFTKISKAERDAMASRALKYCEDNYSKDKLLREMDNHIQGF